LPAVSPGTFGFEVSLTIEGEFRYRPAPGAPQQIVPVVGAGTATLVFEGDFSAREPLWRLTVAQYRVTPPGNPTPPKDSTNVALASAGAVASASSFYSTDFSPAFVNDGDRSGRQFWNDATADAFSDILQIDFAGTQTIGQVHVFTVQENWQNPIEPAADTPALKYAVRDFAIEYWTGTSWAPIPGASVTGNFLAWRGVAFTPVTTQKIRVVVTSANSSYSRLTEVEAFTTGLSTQPPGTNVAAASAGATVTASSTYSSDFSASNIIDGDRAGHAFWNDDATTTASRTRWRSGSPGRSRFGR